METRVVSSVHVINILESLSFTRSSSYPFRNVLLLFRIINYNDDDTFLIYYV